MISGPRLPDIPGIVGEELGNRLRPSRSSHSAVMAESERRMGRRLGFTC